MAKNVASLVLFLCFSFLNFWSAFSEDPNTEQLQTYIVHLRLPPSLASSSSGEVQNFYHSFLPATVSGETDVSRMVHSYQTVFTGFAAKLTPEEVKDLEKREGFLYARPEKVYQLHTTHTPRFMGLYPDHGFWASSGYGEGVIIGLLDTGIKSNHPSFNDEGMKPPPQKWNGKCHVNGTSCNHKLIGTRRFVGPHVPAGPHGTHTSSTAAGNFVKDVDVLGNAKGTAVGIAPRAYIAMYQVCHPDGCSSSAIAAGLEAAIPDGVDVLSISLGGDGGPPFYEDDVAIGAFQAMLQGIFVSCSAANQGPKPGTLSNVAPWILTVGASSIDRNIRSTVVLGNNQTFDGETLYQPESFPPTLLPLVHPVDDFGNRGERFASCWDLDKFDVKGKIVICDGHGNASEQVKDAGGAAVIIVNDEDHGGTVEDANLVLPGSIVSFAAGKMIKKYLESTSNPKATILFKGTVLGVNSSPAVASFSSRGPNLASPGILKPDILGPGLNILAAWSQDNLQYNIISGTSMSAPHLSGVAAVLKRLHPLWSPAAIKSAIMTTANTLNLNKTAIVDLHSMRGADIFATGAGHVNPARAADPGLVYDIQPEDYISYLCGLNYTDTQVEIIVKRPIKCSTLSPISEGELNYPTFAVQLGNYSQSYPRTVTNVGEASSTYVVDIKAIPGVDIYVDPDTLIFTDVVQKLNYTLQFARRSDAPIEARYVQGAITWISGKYKVTSAISVEFI